ncbi:hypothetical protein ACJJTC_001773 [Scirpophaga incertulas]
MNDPPDPGGSVLSTDQFLSPQVAYNVTLMSHEESSVDTDQTVSTIMDWSASTNRKRSKCSKICKNCNKKKRKHKMAGKSDGCLCTESDDIISKKSNNTITSDKQCAPSTLPSSESGALGENNRVAEVTSKYGIPNHVTEQTSLARWSVPRRFSGPLKAGKALIHHRELRLPAVGDPRSVAFYGPSLV